MISCSGPTKNNMNEIKEMPFNEKEILDQLDLAFNGTPSEYYPASQPEDIQYNFFLDLENGYCEVASSRIHLFADSTRWVIVFETAGYETRASSAQITLNYIGNCIDYPIDKYPERNYITNSSRIVLVDQGEFERIENKECAEAETFELIGQNIKEIKIRDKFVPFDNRHNIYEKVGIAIRDSGNPNKLIGFGDLIRYLHEINPAVISATEDDLRQHIPKDIPKLMTIDAFHFVSAYDNANPPSQQEMYQLLAKVLITGDTTNWKPTQAPNNSWKNWESGTL